MKKLSLIIASLFVLNLAAEPLPPPEKEEMTFDEIDAEIINLDGKIIETEVTSAAAFQQIEDGKYVVYCYCFKSDSSIVPGAYILVPEEGKELFQELAEKNILNGGSETIYVLVNSKEPIKFDETGLCKLEAVGTRYKKSKGTYSW